jgi:hypothetical protein
MPAIVAAMRSADDFLFTDPRELFLRRGKLVLLLKPSPNASSELFDDEEPLLKVKKPRLFLACSFLELRRFSPVGE